VIIVVYSPYLAVRRRPGQQLNGFNEGVGPARRRQSDHNTRGHIVADDALSNRKIFTGSYDFRAPSLFSPEEKHHLNKALPGLAGAIADAADLYQSDGRVLGLIDGELGIVNTAVLAKVINENLVKKGVRNVGTVEQPVFEREYRPVEVGEVVLRMLLTDDQYGLLKLLPVLRMEDLAPRAPAPPVAEAAPEPEPPLVMNPEELAAGQRAAAKWAKLGSAEQNQLERQRGAEMVARHKARGTAA
jgi:hypothetical protein